MKKSTLPHPGYLALGVAILFGGWWLWQRQNPPKAQANDSV